MSLRTLKLYNPHLKQLEFHQSKARYRVASLGRQAGKSTMAMNELIVKAWVNPKTNYWFISPIYAQAKDQYRKALRYLPYNTIQKKSDTELRLDLINGSSIEYKSGEVLDRLRGATLHGVVIDEVRDQNKDLWPLVIRPMLTTTQGWAAFISTPNGYDAFYDLYQSKDTHWQSFQAPSTCNPLFTQAECDESRSVMSDDEFAQEILAEFREIGRGKAYKHHGVWNQVEQNPFAIRGMAYSYYLPIVVGLDFNVNLMAWSLCQHRAGDFHVSDEISIKNTDTEEMATLLCERLKDHKPGVILIGDATGKANKTSAAGKTDYSIIINRLKFYGIPFRNLTPESNPLVKDRINMVNSRLKAADGSVHLTYNPNKCKYLKRDLERVTIKNGTDGFVLDKKSDDTLTHCSDGLGYVISHYSNEWKTSPGVMRLVNK